MGGVRCGVCEGEVGYRHNQTLWRQRGGCTLQKAVPSRTHRVRRLNQRGKGEEQGGKERGKERGQTMGTGSLGDPGAKGAGGLVEEDTATHVNWSSSK